MKKIVCLATLLFIIVLVQQAKAGFYDEWAKFFQNDLFYQLKTQSSPPVVDNNVVEKNEEKSNKICFYSEMSIGHENDDVKKLQQFLYDQGFYKEGLITGYFGALTKKAVMNFQSYYANEVLKSIGLLKATGYVGQATLKKLHELTQCGAETSKAIDNNQYKNTDIDLDMDIDLTNPDDKLIDQVIKFKWYRLDRSVIKGCHSDAWDDYCYQNLNTLRENAFKFEPCIKYYIEKQGIKIEDFKNNFYLPCSACGCEIPDTYINADIIYADKLKIIGFVETANNSFIPTTTTTKAPIQVTNTIEVPCLVFPHEAYVNEPVHIVSWWDSKMVAEKDQFPSINDVNGEWVLSTGQSLNDIQVIDNVMCQEFFWPYPEGYKYANNEVAGRLSSIRYNEADCYAFKKPGTYLYRATYLKDEKYQKTTYNYICEFKVEENPKYKIIFVTEDKYPGNFAWDPYMKNDLKTVSNNLCTGQAQKFGLNGEFVAIFNLNEVNRYVYRSIKPRNHTFNENQINYIQTKGLVYKNLYCDGRYSRFFDVFNCSRNETNISNNSMFCQLPNMSDLKDFSVLPTDSRYRSVWNSRYFHECEQLFTQATCLERYTANNKPYTTSDKKVYGRVLDRPFYRCIPERSWEPCGKDNCLRDRPTDPCKEISDVTCDESHHLLCAEKEAKTDLERQKQEP